MDQHKSEWGNGSGESWAKWSTYVLKEMERLNLSIEESKKKQSAMEVEIAMLRVKSGVWGLIGGLIPVGITIVIGVFYIFLKENK
jgi:hypothetical protein